MSSPEPVWKGLSSPKPVWKLIENVFSQDLEALASHFRQVGVVQNGSDSPETPLQSGFQPGTSPDSSLSRGQVCIMNELTELSD